MDTRQLFLDRHAAVHARAMQPQGWWKEEDTICADITEAQLRARPTPQHNSIVWLLWHLARCEDVAVNTVIRGGEEVLDRDRWLPKLDIQSRHIGTGAIVAEVDELSQTVNLAALRAYRAAVGRETQAWASTLDFAMLDRLVAGEEVQRAIAKGDFSEPGAWVGRYWAEVAWTHATFLFWLAVEHNWLHMGEIWVIRNLFNCPSY